MHINETGVNPVDCGFPEVASAVLLQADDMGSVVLVVNTTV